MLNKIKSYIIVGASCFALGLMVSPIFSSEKTPVENDMVISNHSGMSYVETQRVITKESDTSPDPLQVDTTKTTLPKKATVKTNGLSLQNSQAQRDLLHTYRETTSSIERIQSKRILMNLTDDDQQDIAMQIIDSEGDTDRLLAYQLISSNPRAVVSTELETLLLQNSYIETEPKNLAANIAAMRNISFDSPNAEHTKERLRELSTHDHIEVRANAIDALGFQDGSKTALPVVVKALNDPSSQVRLSAAETLFNFEKLEASDYDKLFMIASDFNEDVKVRQELLMLLNEHSHNITQTPTF